MKNMYLPGESGHLKVGARTRKSGDLLSFTAHLPHELSESVVHVSRQAPVSVCR